MLCESCKKNNATFHYTKIVNGKIKELHLCEQCAMDNQDFDLDNPFSFHKLFTGFIDMQEPRKEKNESIICHKCGLTYDKFKATGKFGCAVCYETFSDKLESLIRGIHGHNSHKGKIPKRSNERILLKRREESLKSELEDAVKLEEYERAAFLRDELKNLRIKLDSYGE